MNAFPLPWVRLLSSENLRAAQSTPTMGQAKVYPAGLGLTKRPSYPPKGWSSSLQEIPDHVTQNHFLESPVPVLFLLHVPVVDSLGQLRDTEKGERTVYDRGAPSQSN